MSLGRRVAIGGAALLCAGFLALGAWQVQRLQWKTTLIAQIEQRVHAAPVAPPPWPQASRGQDDYRRVQLGGHFLGQQATLVQAATVHGSGFWALHPFMGDDGRLVLVNRGFVGPAQAKTFEAPPATSVTISGLLRMSEPGGGFLRKNDSAAGRWYSRDVAAIAAARGLGPVAPYFIDQDAEPPTSPNARPGAPVGGLTVISFNNHHLVYALTWFALAMMAGAAGVFVARNARGGAAG